MSARGDHGHTLIELVIALAIASVLVLSLVNVVFAALEAREHSRTKNALAREARFAMERIGSAISRSRLLLMPLAEDPATMNSESLIDPGVLAVALDPTLDRDQDGFSDADNDKDGRVDEDWPADSSFDGKPGLFGLDDDNSGITDVSFAGSADDDETGFVGDEDPIDGIDNDGDGAIDEDPPADMNGDGAPGILGFDDDGDGLTDEGSFLDDDEDGLVNEDWIDAVAFFLVGSELRERFPNLNPVNGTQYTERTIAANVTAFRVERLPRGARRNELVDVLLTLSAGDETVTVQSRIRLQGGL